MGGEAVRQVLNNSHLGDPAASSSAGGREMGYSGPGVSTNNPS